MSNEYIKVTDTKGAGTAPQVTGTNPENPEDVVIDTTQRGGGDKLLKVTPTEPTAGTAPSVVSTKE